MSKESIYVPDTSAIIKKQISDLVEKGQISGKIIIPLAVLAELEHQANLNQSEGFLGLEEIKKLRELAKTKKISIEYAGIKPIEAHIKGAKAGAIDDLIREVALNKKGILITADRVQALVAEARGIKTILLVQPLKEEVLDLEKYFDKDMMSIHLKENTYALGKKGKPGDWELVKLNEQILSAHEIKLLASDIIEKTRLSQNAFIEVNEPGITIVQFKNYRIVITKPPFSDGWELTAVRPLVSLELKDYTISENLKKRLSEEAAGILVSGSPGSGKTTFAAALAKEFLTRNKIVKTIESPRDLQVPDQITQYSKNLSSKEQLYNVLLLSRPDYTIFDEMRTAEDFKLYADLRLAGIGLVGVIHATKPIDAIQRFVGKIELGMFPSIIDTVIFIENGDISKVLELKMIIKVPTGMTEADLARPVIEVRDFETKALEYEIYTYGEQTVVVPIKTTKKAAFRQFSYKIKEAKKYVLFYFPTRPKKVIIKINDEPITELLVPKSGELKIHKKSKLGYQILDALYAQTLNFEESL
ncbi:MAG: PINc/VapC family ATPase [Candidatus Nanoarchaeia archaeon]